MGKIVREHIEFKQGGDPYSTLGIGKRAQIDKWFETWASRVKYEIDNNLNITVKKGLYLGDTKITHLPDNLRVEGNLYLNNTPITSLPDNLRVEGNLYLNNTPITSLPDNLRVEGNLFISDTLITHLPKTLKVLGTIYETLEFKQGGNPYNTLGIGYKHIANTLNINDLENLRRYVVYVLYGDGFSFTKKEIEELAKIYSVLKDKIEIGEEFHHSYWRDMQEYIKENINRRYVYNISNSKQYWSILFSEIEFPKLEQLDWDVQMYDSSLSEGRAPKTPKMFNLELHKKVNNVWTHNSTIVWNKPFAICKSEQKKRETNKAYFEFYRIVPN